MILSAKIFLKRSYSLFSSASNLYCYLHKSQFQVVPINNGEEHFLKEIKMWGLGCVFLFSSLLLATCMVKINMDMQLIP